MKTSTKEILYEQALNNLLIEFYKLNSFYYVQVINTKTTSLYGPEAIFQKITKKMITECLKHPVEIVEFNQEMIKLGIEPYEDPITLTLNKSNESDEIIKKALAKRINALEGKKIDALERSHEDNEITRIRYGTTKPEDWSNYSNGITVIVDISRFELKKTPLIFTSLIGTSSHWTTTGATSIYSPTPKQFQVYIQPGTAENAKAWGWHLNYLLISQD